MFASQQEYEIRFDWGMNGMRDVANRGRVAIIVDVLSFSTCVEIACSRGALVFPYRHKDGSAADFARMHGALLASGRGAEGPTLSPLSLLSLAPGKALVLPSPNGATLSLACETPFAFTGCLRNASAVAACVARIGPAVTVVAAAERWPDGSPRFAWEDMVGAGAILHALAGTKSPEARAAEAAFLSARNNLTSLLAESASGRELIERGFTEDVDLASRLDVSACVPRLSGGMFTPFTSSVDSEM